MDNGHPIKKEDEIVQTFFMRCRTSILVVGCSLIFAFILGEIGARAWLRFFAAPEQILRYKHYSRESPEHSLYLYTRHPYLNYVLTPNYRSFDGGNKHNTMGYRGNEIKVPKPKDSFRIVVVGGSTIYSWRINDYHKSFPDELTRVLKGTYGYHNVEVVNAGVPGYNSWENLIDLEFRLLNLEPDLIILYYGTNDIFARLVEGKTYKSDGTGRRKQWGNPSVPLWQRSLLVRIVGLKLGVISSLTIGDLINTPGDIKLLTLGKKADEEAFLLRENPPVYFRRNVRNAVMLSKKNKAQVVIMTWAYDPSEFKTHLREAFTEHNNIIREIAVEELAALFDFEKFMPSGGEYWFEDGAHFTEKGASKAAELAAQFLHERKLLFK